MIADDRRRLWRTYFTECHRVWAENDARHDRFIAAAEAGRYRPCEPDLETPPMPEALRNLACGAKTRAGTPCKRTDLYGLSGRCKFHGGMSTGPQTATGKARAIANLKYAGAAASNPMGTY